MIKPMFVPKKERETIAEREKVEAELDAEWERREAGERERMGRGGEGGGGTSLHAHLLCSTLEAHNL